MFKLTLLLCFVLIRSESGSGGDPGSRAAIGARRALSPRFGLSISWAGKRNFVGRDWRAISGAECGRTAGIHALVGLIGIAQNDVFKVLTIVSIVGIPPTLMAGIYGMNFKNMPEYDWAWGYQYGWAMILLSAVIPLVWFKVKGWF